jgi:hypothetical protein
MGCSLSGLLVDCETHDLEVGGTSFWMSVGLPFVPLPCVDRGQHPRSRITFDSGSSWAITPTLDPNHSRCVRFFSRNSPNKSVNCSDTARPIA